MRRTRRSEVDFYLHLLNIKVSPLIFSVGGDITGYSLNYTKPGEGTGVHNLRSGLSLREIYDMIYAIYESILLYRAFALNREVKENS